MQVSTWVWFVRAITMLNTLDALVAYGLSENLTLTQYHSVSAGVFRSLI